MNPYIDQWHMLIRGGRKNTTYKMAWARSIVELSLERSREDFSDTVITFSQIAEGFLRSFWDQTIYFELNHGPNLKKQPEVLQYTQDLIKDYKEVASNKPVKFIKANFARFGLEDRRDAALAKIATTLKKDVCSRFMKIGRKEYPVYLLDETARTVTFRAEEIRQIAEYSDLLFDAINYRWAQTLEEFNHSPRVAQKVRGIAGDEEPKRKSLTPFRKYLDLDPDTRGVCFQCANEIPKDPKEKAQNASVDHVIPWSFMYDDDLWNLAYCHSGCNSSKSNTLPTSDTIERLERRNERLLGKLPQGKTIHSEMQLAVHNNYLRKFWISFKG